MTSAEMGSGVYSGGVGLGVGVGVGVSGVDIHYPPPTANADAAAAGVTAATTAAVAGAPNELELIRPIPQTAAAATAAVSTGGFGGGLGSGRRARHVPRHESGPLNGSAAAPPLVTAHRPSVSQSESMPSPRFRVTRNPGGTPAATAVPVIGTPPQPPLPTAGTVAAALGSGLASALPAPPPAGTTVATGRKFQHASTTATPSGAGKKQRKRPRCAPAQWHILMILAIGVAIAIAVGFLIASNEIASFHSVMDGICADATLRVQTELLSGERRLEAISAAAYVLGGSAATDLTRFTASAFHEFARTLPVGVADESLPQSLLSVVWAPRINESNRLNWLNATRASAGLYVDAAASTADDSYPLFFNFSVDAGVPAAIASEYYPLLYSFPSKADVVPGFVWDQIPRYRAAMATARSERVTAPVTVRERSDAAPFTIEFRPFYVNNSYAAVPDTAREELCAGFVIGISSPQLVLNRANSLVSGSQLEIDLTLTDRNVSNPDAALIGVQPPRGSGSVDSAFTATRSVTVPGRNWELACTPTVDLRNSYYVPFHAPLGAVMVFVFFALLAQLYARYTHQVLSTDVFLKDLEIARDDAQRATKTKSDFLAFLCHEVRNSLHAIISMTNFVLHTPNTTLRPLEREQLTTIHESSELMRNIVNDALDISKMESGKFEFEVFAFDFPDLCQSVIRVHKPVADSRQLEFAIDVASDVPQWVRGDPIRIRQVISNLLSNAIKFTPPRGRIQLVARFVDRPPTPATAPATPTSAAVDRPTAAAGAGSGLPARRASTLAHFPHHQSNNAAAAAGATAMANPNGRRPAPPRRDGSNASEHSVSRRATMPLPLSSVDHKHTHAAAPGGGATGGVGGDEPLFASRAVAAAAVVAHRVGRPDAAAVGADIVAERKHRSTAVGPAAPPTPAVTVTIDPSSHLHGPASGHADLRRLIEVSVIDTGVGIPKEAHQTIWESYSHARLRIAHETGGTGLGLAIVKRVMEGMGGRVSFETKIGHGSTFRLTIPVEPLQPAEAVACQNAALKAAATERENRIRTAAHAAALELTLGPQSEGGHSAASAAAAADTSRIGLPAAYTQPFTPQAVASSSIFRNEGEQFVANPRIHVVSLLTHGGSPGNSAPGTGAGTGRPPLSSHLPPRTGNSVTSLLPPPPAAGGVNNGYTATPVLLPMNLTPLMPPAGQIPDLPPDALQPLNGGTTVFRSLSRNASAGMPMIVDTTPTQLVQRLTTLSAVSAAGGQFGESPPPPANLPIGAVQPPNSPQPPTAALTAALNHAQAQAALHAQAQAPAADLVVPAAPGGVGQSHTPTDAQTVLPGARTPPAAAARQLTLNVPSHAISSQSRLSAPSHPVPPDLPSPPAATAAAAANRAVLLSHVVLLVEDAVVNQRIVRGMVDGRYCTLEVASNGAEGVRMYRAAPNRYSLILMDINMPVMSGDKATIALRTIDRCTIPIVAMTANAMPVEVARYVSLGMNHVITKPFLVEHVLAAFKTFIPGYQNAFALLHIPIKAASFVAMQQQQQQQQQLLQSQSPQIDRKHEVSPQPQQPHVHQLAVPVAGARSSAPALLSLNQPSLIVATSPLASGGPSTLAPIAPASPSDGLSASVGVRTLNSSEVTSPTGSGGGGPGMAVVVTGSPFATQAATTAATTTTGTDSHTRLALTVPASTSAAISPATVSPGGGGGTGATDTPRIGFIIPQLPLTGTGGASISLSGVGSGGAGGAAPTTAGSIGPFGPTTGGTTRATTAASTSSSSSATSGGVISSLSHFAIGTHRSSTVSDSAMPSPLPTDNHTPAWKLLNPSLYPRVSQPNAAFSLTGPATGTGTGTAPGTGSSTAAVTTAVPVSLT